MARKRTQPAPFTAVASTDLAEVVGGRIAVRKGPDPDVVTGLKGLTESVAALGQKQQADQAGSQQMMSQMMQQMMGRR